MQQLIDNVYTIKKEIGRGGMAKVFLAEVDLERFDYTPIFAYTQIKDGSYLERRQKAKALADGLRKNQLDPKTMQIILKSQGVPMPEKRVALKIASPGADARRFEVEWNNLFCLNHENLVKVYGGGTHEGAPYYAMELLENIITPETIMSKLTIRQKLEILIQAGHGLQHLHDNGVVHRDIKPGNIITTGTSDSMITRIADLGLAKNLEEDLGITQHNMIIGSPAYMAPEQISSSSDVDNRADIYSLGATMYEFVTGKRPYHDSKGTYQIIIAISAKVPPMPLLDHIPDIPEPVCEIVSTAMKFDPAERYNSIREMIDDINAYLEKESSAYTVAQSFELADKNKSSVEIGSGRYIFEKLNAEPKPAAVPTRKEPLSAELDTFRLLVMNRKRARHNIFQRCAKGMKLQYVAALNPHDAAEMIKEKKADIAVFEYARNDKQVIALSEVARVAGIPFLLNGNSAAKADILLAARLGAASFMVNPISEKPLKAKFLTMLESTGKEMASAEMSGVDFGGRNSPAERAKIVIKKAHQLLALPHATAKTISLCNDPNASAEELAKPIRTDPAIAAMVLRRANSAALGGSQKIGTIRDAVVRIGRRETKQLAITMAVYKLFGKEEKSFGFNRFEYWVHALGVGVIGQVLAGLHRKLDGEDTFLCGLLHDLGKIVFDDYLNEEFKGVIQRAATEGIRINKIEQQIFQMDHAAVGAQVAEKWNLPAEIAEAIKLHHRDEEDSENITMPQLVRMSNSIVKAIGAGHSGDYFADDFDNETWRNVLRRFDAIPNYCSQIRDELIEFTEMLGIKTAKSGFAARSDKKNKTVSVVPDGLGVLLSFFFVARGYDVELVSWKEMIKSKNTTAFDARHLPDDTSRLLRSPESLWGREVFMLTDESARNPIATLHQITPPNDFFKLEQALLAVEEQ